MSDKQGSCLCGAVRVSAPSLSNSLGVCHCGMCRKWSGGPLMAVDCGTDVSFEGEENVGVYDSSDWAQRGFCKTCGSNLFYKLKQTGQYIMSPTLFDEINFVFDHQVFIEEKPDYYEFLNETKNITGEDVFAMFSESNE